MRRLTIDDAAKAKAARIVSYAMDHPYYSGRAGQPVPGDNPNYTAKFDSYRAVFTFTHHGGEVYRHLSLSVPSSRYPHLAAAFTIATMFGFTGWDARTIDRPPEGWDIAVNEVDHCIVLVQSCGAQKPAPQ